MANQKTVIFGLAAVVFLAGITWYASAHSQNIANQAASILGGGEEQSVGEILTDEFFLGSPDAPVTIIEYSSHFCGHCANFHNNTLPLIVNEYVKTGRVKFIPRLPAPLTGMAVLCAHDQGKFQEFNDYLFKNAEEMNIVIKEAKEINASIKDARKHEMVIIEAMVNYLKATAVNLGLNQEEFNLCFNSNKRQAAVEKWFEQAQEAGVEGTPTFFINGQQIVGNQPYSVFKNAIEGALAE